MTDSTALLTVDRPMSVELGTLRATSPADLVASAAAIARPLADVIERQRLFVVLNGRKFVKVEGWTTCAALLGCTPHEESIAWEDGVYTAVVVLRRLTDGQVVARASAECGAPDELDRQGRPIWAHRPAYARRSMAITRATGKACRLAFSWIVTMGGYEATPAEEMNALGPEGPDDDGRVVSSTPAASPQTPSLASGPSGTPLDERMISDKQVGRLKGIARDAGWTPGQITKRLAQEGVRDPGHIRRGDYEAICEAFKLKPPPATDDEAPF